MNSAKIRRITRIGVFVALTIVGAWISVPIGQVPVTLQLFFVLLAGYVLGAKDGFIAMCVYLLLGALGLPVFANFAGGFSVILSPVGGYLISFPLAAFVSGKMFFSKNKFSKFVLSVLLPVFVIYLLGGLQLSYFVKSYKKAIAIGIIPFIPFDIAKAYIALAVAFRLNKHYNKNKRKEKIYGR